MNEGWKTGRKEWWNVIRKKEIVKEMKKGRTEVHKKERKNKD